MQKKKRKKCRVGQEVNEKSGQETVRDEQDENG